MIADDLPGLRLDPSAISAGERDHVVESHALETERGQCRAKATRAVQNYLAVLVGRDLIDVAFQNSARHRDRARDHALGVLVRLPHVDEREIFPGPLHAEKILGANLLNLPLGLIHNLLKLGQRHSVLLPGTEIPLAWRILLVAGPPRNRQS